MNNLMLTQPPRAEVNSLIALYNGARYAEVENRTRALLGQYPDDGFLWNLLGASLQLQGKDALSAFQKTAQLLPDDAEAHYNLGFILGKSGRLAEAEPSYRRALEIKPNHADAHNNLGFILQAQGRFSEAEASFRMVLEINPGLVSTWYNLAVVLGKQGRFGEAEDSYRRALVIKPDYAEAHNNLGFILYQGQSRLAGAEASYRRALEIKPDYAEAHCNLGAILHKLGRLAEAEVSCRRALEIKPNYAEAHCNLGATLDKLGRLVEAEASYRKALTIKPEFADASFGLSTLLLSKGQYAEAWAKYEARYHRNKSEWKVIRPDIPFPQWQGEPLDGKSILIWPEQGFGDEIQFARYFPLLRNKNISRLTLVSRQPLKALQEMIDGVDAVILPSESSSLPLHDYWTFPMSLPLHFATTVETIPAKLPYLSAPPEKLNQWRNRFPIKELKVGLVWKGNAEHKNDANRSLPGLASMASLWSISGVTFVSLQKGQGEEEAATPPEAQPILHLGSDIVDFADTAAIVAQLDLVICIDTAIAHLAGALNKACWVLLPAFGTDWRWLRERTDSPWYPGVMRLFRQTKAGDWAATINEVAQALETWRDEHVISNFK